ncbi:hypothetical protein ACS5PN_17285 [Roseateles sp. NT4]|uniref:hypothetical protein n=1 Tax=Roseateles sp. NT4 TaxID=3453715 RepID=UPI003EEAB7E2
MTKYLVAKSSVIAVLTALSLAGCGGGGSESETAGGPCNVEVDEPVLTIQKATNASGGAAIAEIRLTNIKINDVVPDPSLLVIESKGMSVDGGALVCKAPCGFWSGKAKISFTAAANGFQSKSFIVDAVYSTQTGNCPARLTNGTKIEVALAPI